MQWGILFLKIYARTDSKYFLNNCWFFIIPISSFLSLPSEDSRQEGATLDAGTKHVEAANRRGRIFVDRKILDTQGRNAKDVPMIAMSGRGCTSQVAGKTSVVLQGFGSLRQSPAGWQRRDGRRDVVDNPVPIACPMPR